MTINHEKKLIFIHIPKNAGTSIIEAMGVENCYHDRPIKDYKKHYKKYWREYKKFTVIRDPIDRFISAYKFARMDESEWFSSTNHMGLNKHPHYDICNSMDINGYVDYFFKNPEEINRWVFPQSCFISDKEGKIEIDYFVRYENLLEDLKKIKIEIIENLNSSKIENNNLIKLTKQSIKKLYCIYDIDYKNFNYKRTLKSIFSYF